MHSTTETRSVNARELNAHHIGMQVTVIEPHRRVSGVLSSITHHGIGEVMCFGPPFVSESLGGRVDLTVGGIELADLPVLDVIVEVTR